MIEFESRLGEAITPLLGSDVVSVSPVRPDVEDRVRLRVEGREVRRQNNLERIVELALAETPAELAQDASAISSDWLARFFEFAQDVSEDTAQTFWARILATYVANPEHVFKRSLIVLHALDNWELEAFVEYCGFSFGLESGWRFMFEEALTRQEIWGYVHGNDYTQHFINIGLLAPELSSLRAASSRGLRIRYFEKDYELLPPAEGNPRQICSHPVASVLR